MNIIIKLIKRIKGFFSRKSKPKLDYHKDYWFPNGPDGSKAFNRKIKIDKIYKLNNTITYTQWNISRSKHKRIYSIPIGSSCKTGKTIVYNNVVIGKWNVTFGNKHKKRIEKINKIYR